MRNLKAGVLYFVQVFGAGFVLGAIRVLWIVRRLGARAAELQSTPMGSIALSLKLIAEFTLVPWRRGLSIGQYFATRHCCGQSITRCLALLLSCRFC
jgi:hypothetical protein